MLNEKARSKSKQRLMGMVYAYKNGNLDLEDLPKSLSDKIKDISDGTRRKTGDKRKKTKGISKKSSKDFASTKHEGLPEKVNEEINITKFDNFISEENDYDNKIEIYKIDQETINNTKNSETIKNFEDFMTEKHKCKIVKEDEEDEEDEEDGQKQEEKEEETKNESLIKFEDFFKKSY